MKRFFRNLLARTRKTVRQRPPRPLERQHRYQHGFRPQLEELEDRRVLSSLQPAVINYPQGPVHGANLHANFSVISYPTGPLIPSSLLPNGPCFPNGPIR
jgi:hypothetical protein